MPTNVVGSANDERKHGTKPRNTSREHGTTPTGQMIDPSLPVQRASATPQQLTPSNVLHLQRTIGNRAVNQLLSRANSPATVQPQRVENGSNARPTTEAAPIHAHAKRQPAIQRPVIQRPVIQRVVQSKYSALKLGGFQTKYYSTYDTATEFDTADEAWAHDEEMAKSSGQVFDPYQRYPTNYSYYNTPERNVMPLSKQGPHTLSHSSISFRLAKRMREEGGTKRMWETQVLDRPKFGKYFKGERPGKMKKGQRKRFKMDYGLLHDRLSGMMGKDDDYSEQKHELMMRLMQLHPYAAYGKGKMSKRALKGKGERRDAPFDQAFDTRAKFTVAKRYLKFQQMRQKMYKDSDKDD